MIVVFILAFSECVCVKNKINPYHPKLAWCCQLDLVRGDMGLTSKLWWALIGQNPFPTTPISDKVIP